MRFWLWGRAWRRFRGLQPPGAERLGARPPDRLSVGSSVAKDSQGPLSGGPSKEQASRDPVGAFHRGRRPPGPRFGRSVDRTGIRTLTQSSIRDFQAGYGKTTRFFTIRDVGETKPDRIFGFAGWLRLTDGPDCDFSRG